MSAARANLKVLAALVKGTAQARTVAKRRGLSWLGMLAFSGKVLIRKFSQVSAAPAMSHIFKQPPDSMGMPGALRKACQSIHAANLRLQPCQAQQRVNARRGHASQCAQLPDGSYQRVKLNRLACFNILQH